MIYLKIQGLILDKEKIKENDAIVYILTKNNGILKCYLKGIFRPQSKNLSLFEPGNFNRLFINQFS
jgi:recombinational DNA repair protein (RecF pathway)